MHFVFTDEQRMIGETVRSFFAEHATSARTRAAMAGEGVDRALWTSLAQGVGLAGLALPEEAGGAGLGMVELALDHLSTREVVVLDDERRAAMVSNLMVVLCGERETQPIVNTGTLYQ